MLFDHDVRIDDKGIGTRADELFPAPRHWGLGFSLREKQGLSSSPFDRPLCESGHPGLGLDSSCFPRVAHYFGIRFSCSFVSQGGIRMQVPKTFHEA